MTIDLHAIAERYHQALDAKLSKGEMTPKGVAAITDSVADVPELVAEVERLTRWKAEALPVMDGLRELGQALKLPLGARITGPQALAEVRRLLDITDQDALTREAIRLAEGSAMSGAELVECFKSMRDNEWKRRAIAARERATAAERAIEQVREIAYEMCDMQRRRSTRRLGNQILAATQP